MEKQNWPWKKKSSEIILGLAEPYSPKSKQLDEKGDGDDASIQRRDPEEVIKSLNEELLAASQDISSKEKLLKQHEKVVEEAVTGWEKAEAEAIAMKQELNSMIQLRALAEEKNSHLDGALKECMRQLHQVREEQEDSFSKQTKEWEKVRCDLEEKLEDATRKLIDTKSENSVISESLIQSGKAVSEAEAEVKLLKASLESTEKENASLKNEMIIMKKDSQIRNEERDATNKKLTENVKKVVRLEAECNRLRALVRKKLPDPATLLQMKLEVDGTDSKKKKFVGKPKSILVENRTEEEESLSTRLLAMEEEAKALKEVLTKKENELQSARIMCAKTASKLSSVEEQLEILCLAKESCKIPTLNSLSLDIEASRSPSATKERSVASLSEDRNDNESCSESWASALITELAQFKKGKAIQKPKKILGGVNSVDLMEDFIEMERLASLSTNMFKEEIRQPNCESSKKERGIVKDTESDKKIHDLEEFLAKRDVELESAKQLCQEISGKLALAEEQLTLSNANNSINEANIVSLEEKLNMNRKAQEVASPQKPIARLRAHIRQLSGGSLHSYSPSIGSTDEIKHISSDNEVSVEPELAVVVHKVARLIEDLALAFTSHWFSFPHFDRRNKIGLKDLSPDCLKQSVALPTKSEFDADVQKFIAISNQFLHGKGGITVIFSELSSILGQITRMASLDSDDLVNNSKKLVESDRYFSRISENEHLCGADSPVSEASKSDGSEKEAARVVPTYDRISFVSRRTDNLLKLKKELQIAKSDRITLESHMRAELARFVGIENELSRVKLSNDDLQTRLRVANEKLEHMKCLLTESEKKVGRLQELKDSVSEELSNVKSFKADLEGKLKIREDEIHRLHEKVRVLEKEISEEHGRNEYLKSQLKDLQKELQRETSMKSSSCKAVGEEEKPSKEEEMRAAATKLAECQQTILALGKQLKQLSLPELSTNSTPLATSSSIDSKLHADPYASLADEKDASADWKESRRLRRSKHDLKWNSQDSNVSDILDLELAKLSTKCRQAGGKTMQELLGDRSHEHAEFIEAVVNQIPSSPEMEPTPARLTTRIISKKKKNPFDESFKSSNSFNSSEKHGNSFSRFFSRAKGYN